MVWENGWWAGPRLIWGCCFHFCNQFWSLSKSSSIFWNSKFSLKKGAIFPHFSHTFWHFWPPFSRWVCVSPPKCTYSIDLGSSVQKFPILNTLFKSIFRATGFWFWIQTNILVSGVLIEDIKYAILCTAPQPNPTARWTLYSLYDTFMSHFWPQ